ncbi:mucin-16 isoform X2 [Sitophilus oryzae]|nr:mucin-16 isoform X2 [Sitophilus oryzae]
MKAWTLLLEPGPALVSVYLILAVSVQINAAPASPEQNDEQSTEIEYYPVADATGCYYNFQHYDEGDRIITNEPCLNCTCHNRMLMCYLRVCPFTKAIGANCKVENRPDQCCPVITCPEVPVHLVTSTVPSTAVGHLNEYGCTIDSLFYSDGARVPSDHENPCELCYCIRNKTACVMQECTLNVEGCKPVYQEGVCCPVRYNCEHPDYLEGPTTPQITTTSTTTTTVAPTTTLQPFECIFNGQAYSDGELVKKDIPCEKCYCMRGDIVCAVQECGPTPLDKVNCTALPVREGQCCPDTYDCAGVIEEELTTLSSTTSEFEPTTPVIVTEEERVTEKLLTSTPEEQTAVPEISTQVSPIEEGQHEVASEEVPILETESPEIITEITSKPIETSQPTKEAGEQTTLPQFETRIEGTTESTEETEKPIVEHVTAVGVEPAITEEERVTIVTAITPEEDLSKPTESPVESITSRISETIESITTRVTDTIEAITTAIAGSSTEKPEIESVTDIVKAEEEPTEVTHVEEITKLPSVTKEFASTQQPEDETDKTTVIIPTIEKEIPESSPKTSITDKEFETTEGSAEGPVTEEYEHPTTSLSTEAEVKLTEPSVPEESKPLEELTTSIESVTTEKQILDTSVITEVPSSSSEATRPSEITETPIEEESAPTTTSPEGVTEKSAEKDLSETTKPTEATISIETSTPKETAENATLSLCVEGDCTREGELSTEKISQENAEQAKLPTTTKTPELSQSESTVSETEKAQHTTELYEPTTEKEEVIIVTEIPTRKTELPESMDHVSETALSTEKPKPETEKTELPELPSQTEKTNTPTETSETETKASVTEIPALPEYTTQVSEGEERIKVATEVSTEDIEKTPDSGLQITTELPKEEENEIDLDDVGVRHHTPSESITEAEIPETTRLPIKHITTEKVSEEQITEETIVPEVCTSETECAPGGVAQVSNISNIGTTPQTEIQRTALPEGTTESNKIPEIEGFTKESNEIPEVETEGILPVTSEPVTSGKEEVPEEGSGTTEQEHEVKGTEGEQITTVGYDRFATEQGVVTEEEKPSEHVTEQSTESETKAAAFTDMPQQTEIPEREIPGEGNCLVDGKTYKNNSSVPPINHCQSSCICVSSILRCESIECLPAPEGMQNCLPVFSSPESCCPTYSCTGPEATSPMESDSHIKTTTPIIEVASTTSEYPEGTEEPEFSTTSKHITEESVVTEGETLPKITSKPVSESTEESKEATESPATESPESSTSYILTTETQEHITEVPKTRTPGPEETLTEERVTTIQTTFEQSSSFPPEEAEKTITTESIEQYATTSELGEKPVHEPELHEDGITEKTVESATVAELPGVSEVPEITTIPPLDITETPDLSSKLKGEETPQTAETEKPSVTTKLAEKPEEYETTTLTEEHTEHTATVTSGDILPSEPAVEKDVVISEPEEERTETPKEGEAISPSSNIPGKEQTQEFETTTQQAPSELEKEITEAPSYPEVHTEITEIPKEGKPVKPESELSEEEKVPEQESSTISIENVETDIIPHSTPEEQVTEISKEGEPVTKTTELSEKEESKDTFTTPVPETEATMETEKIIEEETVRPIQVSPTSQTSVSTEQPSEAVTKSIEAVTTPEIIQEAIEKELTTVASVTEKSESEQAPTTLPAITEETATIVAQTEQITLKSTEIHKDEEKLKTTQLPETETQPGVIAEELTTKYSIFEEPVTKIEVEQTSESGTEATRESELHPVTEPIEKELTTVRSLIEQATVGSEVKQTLEPETTLVSETEITEKEKLTPFTEIPKVTESSTEVEQPLQTTPVSAKLPVDHITELPETGSEIPIESDSHITEKLPIEPTETPNITSVTEKEAVEQTEVPVELTKATIGVSGTQLPSERPVEEEIATTLASIELTTKQIDIGIEHTSKPENVPTIPPEGVTESAVNETTSESATEKATEIVPEVITISKPKESTIEPEPTLTESSTLGVEKAETITEVTEVPITESEIKAFTTERISEGITEQPISQENLTEAELQPEQATQHPALSESVPKAGQITTVLPSITEETEISSEIPELETEKIPLEGETGRPAVGPEGETTVPAETITQATDVETQTIAERIGDHSSEQPETIEPEVTSPATVSSEETALPAFTSPELSTPTPETKSNVSQSAEDLFTSGPVEVTTRRHIPGELSTSAPIVTEPTTESVIATESSRPTIPGEQVPEAGDYDIGEEEEEEDQSAFGPGTCRYGGKVYVSAQQIPRDDPCDFCFCFRSDIICLQQSCPPPIPRCHEEPIRGFCCPRYECPVAPVTAVNFTTSTTTTTTTLPPHFLSHAYKGRATKTGCQIQGKAYKVGEVIRATSGPCLHCICGGDGQMKCDPKPCSPEPMLRQMIAAAASRRRR